MPLLVLFYSNPLLQAPFLEAMKMTGEELVEKIKFYYEAWLPARTIVEAAIIHRYQVTIFILA
jgi:hypothetical protein